MKYIHAVSLLLLSSCLMLSCKKKSTAPAEEPAPAPAPTPSSWTAKSSGTTKKLYGVHFYNSKFGVIAADSSTVLKTTDGGLSWQTLTPPPVSGPVQSIVSSCYMLDSLTIVINHYYNIQKSTDGGLTWTTYTITPLSYYSNFTFINSSIGFTYGYSGILKTVDGGNTWTSVPGFTASVSKISFTSPQVGWASSGLNIYKTTDGGNTWIITNTGNTNSQGQLVPFFLNDQTVFADYEYFNTSTIKKTNDGGLSWSTVYSDNTLTDNQNASWYIDANKGFEGRGLNRIRYTTNGGATWTVDPISLGNKVVTAFYFTSATSGWAVGTKGLLLKYTN